MLQLRRAALLAVVCGQVAAAVAGVLPAPALPVAAALTLAGERLSRRPERGRALRTAATALCLLVALAFLPRVVAAGSDENGLRGVLGTLLVAVVALQTLTWGSRRDVQTGVVGAFGLLVLGGSFAPDVLVGFPILLGWVACVLAVVLAARERVTEGADVVLTAPPARGQPATAAALATVLGLVAFLLVPVPEEAGLRSRIAQAAQAAPAVGGGRSAPGAYTGDTVDLRMRGELTDLPLIEVPRDSPPLWRSDVYTDWDGSAWRRRPSARPVAGPPFVLGTAAGPTRTDRVQVERRASGPVWAPGPVVQVEVPVGGVRVDEHGAVGGRLAPEYVVTSAVVAPSDAQLRSASGRDETDPRWTRLAPSVPERVRALGRELTRDAPSRIEAVRAVEQWLADNARYDLDSPVPQPGEDAVDRFLFVDRVGFCEQFAAAEVLLLRAAGIPARFVSGLAYGVETGRDRRTFRQKDLHTWVEVHHLGIGWVASDPTPPTTQLNGAPLRVRVAARLSVALARADDLPGGRPALAGVLLAATALAGAVTALARRRRPAAQRFATQPVDASGRPALQAFLRFDRRLGAAGRRSSETLTELQARLAAPPEVSRGLQLVADECYAPVPPADVAQVRALLEPR